MENIFGYKTITNKDNLEIDLTETSLLGGIAVVSKTDITRDKDNYISIMDYVRLGTFDYFECTLVNDEYSMRYIAKPIITLNSVGNPITSSYLITHPFEGFKVIQPESILALYGIQFTTEEPLD